MKADQSIVLGIESAVEGGSISVFADGLEILSRSGNGTVARAEELLPAIHSILQELNMIARDIDTIVVSTGPGSYTGIRVGIATVLGLRTALQVRCVGISALQAMALSDNDLNDVIAAVPMGRNMVCSQMFRKRRPPGQPEVSTFEELAASIDEFDGKALLHKTIYDQLTVVDRPTILGLGYNLASYIAAAANTEYVNEDLSPVFVERK